MKLLLKTCFRTGHALYKSHWAPLDFLSSLFIDDFFFFVGGGVLVRWQDSSQSVSSVTSSSIAAADWESDWPPESCCTHA